MKKCPITEYMHFDKGECRCIKQLHLNLKGAYCICWIGIDYCGDTWRIVDQEAAKFYMWKINYNKGQLGEYFEYE